MNPLELVRLPALMQRTSGRSETLIALIDGPVLMNRPDLWTSNVRHLGSPLPATCAQPTSWVCMHGTFVAGVLSAKRGTPALGAVPLSSHKSLKDCASGSVTRISKTSARKEIIYAYT